MALPVSPATESRRGWDVAAVEALGKVDEVPPPATSYPVLVKLQGRKPA